MLHKKENQFNGLFIVKRKHPVRMLPLWYARADSNRWPTESESVLKHSFFLGVSMVSCFAGATQVQHHATTYSVRCNITAQNSLTHSAELNKKNTRYGSSPYRVFAFLAPGAFLLSGRILAAQHEVLLLRCQIKAVDDLDGVGHLRPALCLSGLRVDHALRLVHCVIRSEIL